MLKKERQELVQDIISYLRQEQAEGETEVAMARPLKRGHKIPTKDPEALLEEFRKKICDCQKCPLGATRTKFVFGVGNPRALLLFIGEGPGFEEDRQGEPFVGPAGRLLNKIIESMKMKREDVYIANMVKCHPMIDPAEPEKRGNDRPPTFEEMSACNPYLQRQIAILKPKVICTLGSTAAKFLLGKEEGISRFRGQFFEYRPPLHSELSPIPVMPTYHPAALLRNPSLKKDVWKDMKMILAKLKELA